MRLLVRSVLIVGSIGYLAICVLLYSIQRSLIYYPRPAENPGKTLRLKTPDGDTLVRYEAREGNSPAVIYFGGNAEDVSLDVADFEQAFPNHALYLMHYRGYGGSAGKPSEQALFADALALFDEVRQHHSQIVVIGRSLGSGVATYLTSQREAIQQLILVTPFDSLAAVAARQYPLFPVRWILQDRYESVKYAPAIKAPTLILAAGNDTLIPNANSENLRDRFKPGLVRYQVIPGADHNSISEPAEYWRLLAATVR